MGSLRLWSMQQVRLDYAGVTVNTGYFLPDDERHTVKVVMTAADWTLYVDGAQVASAAWTITWGNTSTTWYVCADSGDLYAPTVVYRASITYDNTVVADLDPANVSADYTTITNTGSAGGNWTINRATSGFKTTVVDRPLVLFGGGQTMAATVPVPGTGTRLRARRAYGAAGTIGVVATTHDGSAPALSGVTEAYCGEAIFSRVLSPAEIERAGQELFGIPHYAQPDPHPGYPPLLAGTTAAALPTTAREGTIVVLADNSVAIRTRSGGWQQFTTNPLPGAPPA
jgi:hypothetical protein